MDDLHNDARVAHYLNMVPTSQSSGGEVHANDLAMSAPGSQPVSAPAPEWPGQAPETLPLPVDTVAAAGSNETDPAWITGPDGAKSSRPAHSGASDPGGFGAGAGRWTLV